MHEGTVAFADAFAGYGNLVIVEHGDRSYSLYGYLARWKRRHGQTELSTGRCSGRAGGTPAVYPALYFELRIDGEAVDPLQWFRP